jgi:hypothetical protein
VFKIDDDDSLKLVGACEPINWQRNTQQAAIHLFDGSIY